MAHAKDKLSIKHPNNTFFEALRDIGETVGVAVTEPMDVRIVQDAPYAVNQH